MIAYARFGTENGRESLKLVSKIRFEQMAHEFPFGTFRPGKRGLLFEAFRCSRKFSTGTTRKVVCHFFPNRNFRKVFVKDKNPGMVNYLRAQVGTQLISLINKVTGLNYDMRLRAWCNTCSLVVNFWQIRTLLKNIFRYPRVLNTCMAVVLLNG